MADSPRSIFRQGSLFHRDSRSSSGAKRKGSFSRRLSSEASNHEACSAQVAIDAPLLPEHILRAAQHMRTMLRSELTGKQWLQRALLRNETAAKARTGTASSG